MKFEWNRDKAASNVMKHKVSFEEAVTVFYDPLAATFEDLEHSRGERRWLTIGYPSRDRLLVPCHTERRGGVRLISGQQATRRERNRHEAES